MEDSPVPYHTNSLRKTKQLIHPWTLTTFPSQVDASSSIATSKSSSSPNSLAKIPDQPPAYRMPMLDLTSSRQTIHIWTAQTAAFYSVLVQKFLTNHHLVDMTGLENAIEVALNTANLLQRRKVARIALLNTAYEKVTAQRQRTSYKANIVITMERTDEFHDWLLQNARTHTFVRNRSDVEDEADAYYFDAS